MSVPRRDDSTGRPMSLPAILAALTGAGLLFVYWKLNFLFENISGALRMLLLIGAGALLLWGAARFYSEAPSKDARRRAGQARRQVSLPRPGQFYLLIMIVVFSGALLGRSNMLMLVYAMLAGPFVVNGWITYSMLKRTAVERRTPARVMAGEPLTVELALVNRKRVMTCWLMSARDTIRNADERLEAGVVFTRVPAASRRTGQYQVRLMRRGRYELGPVQLAARFPLGIVERSLIFESPDEILVYPRLGRLASRWMREHFLASDPVERRELRRGAFDDEFHRIREFRWGDNPRAIHWRTSARHNALMVREYRQSRDLNLLVLVDLWLPPGAGGVGGAARERLELAVSLAASICVAHMRESRDSTLHVSIAGVRLAHWEGESRMSNADPLMDQFALAEGHASPDVATMLDAAAAKRLHGTRTVLITTRRDGTAERRDLDRIAALHASSDIHGGVEMLEADHSRLESLFEFV